MIGGIGKSPFFQVSDEDYMTDNEIYSRQQYRESTFDGSAVSPAGATSIAQITRRTFNYGLERGYVPKGTKYEDLAEDDDLAIQFQIAYMEDLMSRDWNKTVVDGEQVPDDVIVAKALGAYNAGPTRFVNILNDMKADGIDIYSMDFVEKLDEYHLDSEGKGITETKDYITDIVIGGDEQWEEDYEGAHEDYLEERAAEDNSPIDSKSPLRQKSPYEPHDFWKPSSDYPDWLNEIYEGEFLSKGRKKRIGLSEYAYGADIIRKMTTPGYQARLYREVKNYLNSKGEPTDKYNVLKKMASVVMERIGNVLNTREYLRLQRGDEDYNARTYYKSPDDIEIEYLSSGYQGPDDVPEDLRLHEWYHAVTAGNIGLLGSEALEAAHEGDYSLLQPDINNVATAQLLEMSKSGQKADPYLSDPTEVYARLNVVHELLKNTVVLVPDKNGNKPGDKGYIETREVIWNNEQETRFTPSNLRKLKTYLSGDEYKSRGPYDDIVEFFGVPRNDPRANPFGEGYNIEMKDEYIMKIMNDVASNEGADDIMKEINDSELFDGGVVGGVGAVRT